QCAKHICLITCILWKFISSHGQWAAIVPPKISAVQGSCVVIPCSYTYPNRVSKEILNRKQTLFWGNLQTRECTMMLDSFRRTDTGPFYCRIEFPFVAREKEGFSITSVCLNVQSNPPVPSLSVQVRDKITASCSVSHSCPSYPPQFIWSHPGIVTLRLKKLNMWEWETVSTVTLKPLPIDSNKNLTCTVKYRGGKQARNSVSVYNQNITPISVRSALPCVLFAKQRTNPEDPNSTCRVPMVTRPCFSTFAFGMTLSESTK
uniref:Ig-like domain-containing protein n=1 Tax=Labrus bergylta TaxID=56723 RepID=A0A3Q3F483_9LABR